MRISDWSSDVCSSDLVWPRDPITTRSMSCFSARRVTSSAASPNGNASLYATPARSRMLLALRTAYSEPLEIGRASCREGVCQYVLISVVAGSVQKKEYITDTLSDEPYTRTKPT